VGEHRGRVSLRVSVQCYQEFSRIFTSMIRSLDQVKHLSNLDFLQSILRFPSRNGSLLERSKGLMRTLNLDCGN
jgi:hypothetical protein